MPLIPSQVHKVWHTKTQNPSSCCTSPFPNPAPSPGSARPPDSSFSPIHLPHIPETHPSGLRPWQRTQCWCQAEGRLPGTHTKPSPHLPALPLQPHPNLGPNTPQRGFSGPPGHCLRGQGSRFAAKRELSDCSTPREGARSCHRYQGAKMSPWARAQDPALLHPSACWMCCPGRDSETAAAVPWDIPHAHTVLAILPPFLIQKVI